MNYETEAQKTKETLIQFFLQNKENPLSSNFVTRMFQPEGLTVGSHTFRCMGRGIVDENGRFIFNGDIEDFFEKIVGGG